MILSLIVIFQTLFFKSSVSETVTVENLRCGYAHEPMAVEPARPSFSWELHSTERNVSQHGYRILVSEDSTALAAGQGEIWDAQVISSSSIQVLFKGRALQA